MAGKIEQLTGVNIDTGLKYYRDVSINKGTRALFDMSSSWAGGVKSVAAEEAIKDLTFNNVEGSFNKDKDYLNGGMVYTGISGDVFRLPEIAAPKVDDNHWLFTLWAKFTSPGSNSFNNQMMYIAGGSANTTSYQMLAAVPTASAGAVTQVEFRVRGKNYALSTPVLPLYDGAVHQLGVELELSTDRATQRIIIYIDKVAVYTSSWGAVLADTSALTNSVRNIGTSGSFPVTWSGSLYRTRLDDLEVAGLTAGDVLAADYQSCRNRFS